MVETLDRESLKALSTDTRQDIIKMLSKRPHTASEISKILDKHVTTVTEHLSVLEKSGLIKRKDSTNKWVYYALTEKGDKLFKPAYYSWIITFSMVFIVAAVLLVGLFGFTSNNIAGDSASKSGSSEIFQANQLSANIVDSASNSVPVEITTPTTKQTISMHVSSQDNTVKLKISGLGDSVIPVVVNTNLNKNQEQLGSGMPVATTQVNEQSNVSLNYTFVPGERRTEDRFERTMRSEHFNIEVKDPVIIGNKVIMPVEINYTEDDHDNSIVVSDKSGKTKIIEIEEDED